MTVNMSFLFAISASQLSDADGEDNLLTELLTGLLVGCRVDGHFG